MRGASTSLASNGESVPTRCPKTTHDLVCLQQPHIRFPAGCEAWSCSFCGPAKARRRVKVLEWARPERFITLTQAPAEWHSLRAKVRKLSWRLRQDGYGVEWAWCVERGGNTGMIHVHALQHGNYIPQRILQDRWGSIVHVSAVRSGSAPAKYALKGAASRYALKGASSAGQLDEHLELNGGRGVHLSRRYLHGKTTAEVEALLNPTDPDLDWIAVPAGEELPPELIY